LRFVALRYSFREEASNIIVNDYSALGQPGPFNLIAGVKNFQNGRGDLKNSFVFIYKRSLSKRYGFPPDVHV
jgi:hypothetical protein